MEAGIVGAGIMGRLLAFVLKDVGWQVTLFDQSRGDSNCSTAAAGLLTPFSELDKADLLIFHLGQDSVKSCWPHILRRLPEAIYFQQNGSLILYHPHDKAEWQHFIGRMSARLDAYSGYCQQLAHNALTEIEPELAKFATAYYFPEEAHIDCQSFLSAFENYSRAIGMKWLLNSPVLSLAPNTITTKERQYTFDMVFDCRGLGARSVFPELRGLRGELIWLHAPDVNLTRPVRLLHPRYSLYIVPRPGQIYLIGASEIEAEDHSPISLRTTLELLTAAYAVHGGFAEARILKTITHCRPTLANHLPRIKYKKGLVAVNGLYRHGYLVAPALANEILRGLREPKQVHYPEIWENDNA
jgi:glycine oxidase